jgi:hypothetical protein
MCVIYSDALDTTNKRAKSINIFNINVFSNGINGIKGRAFDIISIAFGS